MHEAYLERVKAIVLEGLGGVPAEVYLFGSHASGRARRLSDVDVAIDSKGPLPPGLLARIREALEESTVPLHVDLVALSDADDAFRVRVREEGIRWTG